MRKEICSICGKPMGNSNGRFGNAPTHQKHLEFTWNAKDGSTWKLKQKELKKE